MRFIVGLAALGAGALVASQVIFPPAAPSSLAPSVSYAELPVPSPAAAPASARPRLPTGGPNAHAEDDTVAIARAGGRGPEVAAPAVDTPGAEAHAKAIQSGLKKPGCYQGPVNGEWTPATRRAMTAFLAQINAALPVEAPDTVLAALVTANPTADCSTQVAGSEPEPTERPVLRKSRPQPRARVVDRRDEQRPSYSRNLFEQMFGG